MNKKEVFKLAKGFRGRAKNCIRIARERVEKALQNSYRDRRNKKRDMRGLWIQRINAGTRQHGVRFFLYFLSLVLRFCCHFPIIFLEHFVGMSSDLNFAALLRILDLFVSFL